MMSIIDERKAVNAVKMNISNREDLVLISVIPEDQKQRVANDVVCVIDISGSMEEEAPIKNQKGIKEVFGLTKLDVLKHAIKTIILTLGENDRFGLVSFSDMAKVEFEL